MFMFSKYLRCGSLATKSYPFCCKVYEGATPAYIVRNLSVYDGRSRSELSGPNVLSKHKMLGCHLLSVHRTSAGLPLQQFSRSIFIGKLINWVRDSSISDMHSLLVAFNESTLVVGARDYFLFMDTVFGLPWWLNIVLSTFVWRTLLYLPAAAYIERWASARENFMLDCIPLNARLRGSGGDPKQVRLVSQIRRDIMTEHGCQTYKFVLGMVWQVSNMVVLSAGLRQCLLTLGGSGLREAELPWGSALGYPDELFVLPLLNILLNILMIEMDAWKQSKRNEELHLTLKRASLSNQAPYLQRNQTIALYVRRATCVPLMVIYVSVPSALTWMWAIMLIYTLSYRLLLFHPQVRRLSKIPLRSYETSQPHRDFLLFLGTYLKRKSQ